MGRVDDPDGLLADLEAACLAAGKGGEAVRACVGVWALRVEAFASGSPVRPSGLAAAVGFGRGGRNFWSYFRLLRQAGWLDDHGVDLTGAVTLHTPAGTGGWLKIPLGSLAETARRALDGSAGHRRCLPIVGTVVLLGLHNDHRVHSGLRVDLTVVETVAHVSRLRRRLKRLGVLRSSAKRDWLEFPPPSRTEAAEAPVVARRSPPASAVRAAPPAASSGSVSDSWGADESLVPPPPAEVVRLAESYALSAPKRAEAEGVFLEVDPGALLADRRWVAEAMETIVVVAEVRGVGTDAVGLVFVADEIGKTLDWRVQRARDVPGGLASRLCRYRAGALLRSVLVRCSPGGDFDLADNGVIQL